MISVSSAILIHALRITHYALRITHYALRITHYALRITHLRIKNPLRPPRTKGDKPSWYHLASATSRFTHHVSRVALVCAVTGADVWAIEPLGPFTHRLRSDVRTSSRK